MVKPLRRITDKQLGELLIGKGIISQDQLDKALVVQKEKGGLIGEILVSLGYIRGNDLSWAVDRQKALDKKGTHKLIGELLRERGLITEEQLDKALSIQKEKGGLLGEVLVALGYVQESVPQKHSLWKRKLLN